MVVQLNEILTDLENNYSTAKICPYDPLGVEYTDDEPLDNSQCFLALEPGRSLRLHSCMSITFSNFIQLKMFHCSYHRFNEDSLQITRLHRLLSRIFASFCNFNLHFFHNRLNLKLDSK